MVTGFVLCEVGTELLWIIYINPIWDLLRPKWHWGRLISSDSAFFSQFSTFIFFYGLILSEGRAGEVRETWNKKEFHSVDWEHWEENCLQFFSVLKRTSGHYLGVSSSMFLLFPSPHNKFSLSLHPLLSSSSSNWTVPPAHILLTNGLTVNYEWFCTCKF